MVRWRFFITSHCRGNIAAEIIRTYYVNDNNIEILSYAQGYDSDLSIADITSMLAAQRGNLRLADSV